jgi:hypothetical protein
MSFWRARFLGSTVAVIAALAWFTATNHCLLEATRDTHGTATATCHCPDHGHGAGGRGNGNNGRMLACCQGLLNPALEVAQANIKFTPVSLGLQLIAVDRIVPREALQTTSVGMEYDTGPPPQSCFVRIVLKRSLRENAPPFSV